MLIPTAGVFIVGADVYPGREVVVWSGFRWGGGRRGCEVSNPGGLGLGSRRG
jgi:hypothetical protein